MHVYRNLRRERHMESQPRTKANLDLLVGDMLLPRMDPQDDTRTRVSKRRRMREWYARRRALVEAKYYGWLLLHSYDTRSYPLNLEIMGRWLVEQTVAVEPTAMARNQRRYELSRRWQNFTTRLRDTNRSFKKMVVKSTLF